MGDYVATVCDKHILNGRVWLTGCWLRTRLITIHKVLRFISMSQIILGWLLNFTKGLGFIILSAKIDFSEYTWQEYVVVVVFRYTPCQKFFCHTLVSFEEGSFVTAARPLSHTFRVNFAFSAGGLLYPGNPMRRINYSMRSKHLYWIKNKQIQFPV